MSAVRVRSYILGFTAMALLGACSQEQSTATTTRASSDQNSAAEITVANTPLGQLRGEALADNNVLVFKGVHYGQSTGGENRFMPPKPVTAWEGVKEASQFGDSCPQGGEVGRTTKEGELLDHSEDCLVANIWTPGLDDKPRPVMVWLHGRGFYAGSGAEYLYDGAKLAERGDLVVVTINHRLNVFGYLHLGEVGGEDFATTGNAGVQDIELALRWVRDNINTFGGDPDNVTIFGESGGGVKVATLLGTPSAEGLFQRGIIQSGARPTGMPLQMAEENTQAVMEKLGVSTVQELQDLPMETLLGAVANPVRTEPNFGPVTDGVYLPRDMFVPDSAPSAVGVPVMVGSNRDEYSLYERANPKFGEMTEAELEAALKPRLGERYDEVLAAYTESRNTSDPWDLYVAIQSNRFHAGTNALAAVHSQSGPTYLYSFDFPATERLGAAHGAEIPFVFSNATDSPDARPGAEQVQDAVSEAWIAFARTGNPNHAGIPEWPTYNVQTRPGMVFDVETKVVNDIRKPEREVWQGE